MQMTSIFVFIVVALATFVSAQVPIPTRPDGYGVGGPADAHVVVEMFLDLLCPDCQATWPIILQVVQYYGTKIHFRIHTFPLPYHTNAFIVAQGLHVVANVTNRDLDAIFRYATKTFESQAMWYNSATLNMTIPEVIDSIATFAGKTGLVPKDKFLAGMASADLNFETRISWKYACSRGNYSERKEDLSLFFFNDI
jgi:protein-disulfide isomerase